MKSHLMFQWLPLCLSLSPAPFPYLSPLSSSSLPSSLLSCNRKLLSLGFNHVLVLIIRPARASCCPRNLVGTSFCRSRNGLLSPRLQTHLLSILASYCYLYWRSSLCCYSLSTTSCSTYGGPQHMRSQPSEGVLEANGHHQHWVSKSTCRASVSWTL